MRQPLLKVLLVFFLYFFLSNFIYAEDWESDFNNVEKEYVNGEYKKALKKSLSLISSLEKKSGKDNLLTIRSYFQLAKIYEALNKLSDYNFKIHEAQKLLEAAKKDDPNNYAKVLAEATDAFYQFGDYKNAQKYILEGNDLMEKARISDSLLIDNLKYKLAKVYFVQGYTLKARDLVPQILQYRKRRNVRKESIKDPKSGAVKVVKVSRAEYENRKRSYAEILNFRAEVFIRNGHYEKADSLIDIANYYIIKHVRKKDITFVENHFLDGLRYEIVNKFKAANKSFHTALKYSRKTRRIHYRATSKPVQKLYEKTSRTYVIEEKNAKANHLISSLKRKVRRYYGQSSIYYGRCLAMDAEKEVLDDDPRRGQVKLEKLLSDQTYFPKVHLERAEALQLLYEVYLKDDNYEKAEKCLREIVSIKKELMGEEAPSYHLALLDLANFDVLYSSKFKEAEEIYKHSLEEIVSKTVDHRLKGYINYMYTEGKLYELTDQFEKSYSILKEALEEIRLKYTKVHVNYGIALERLANIEIAMGKYKEAEKILNQSADVYKYQGETTYDFHVDYAHTLETLARLYIIQGDYDEAQKTLRKAYRLTRRAEDSDADFVAMSSANEELATLYIHTGKYQETEKTLLEALELKEERYGKESRNLIKILNDLGILYLITGDFTKAEKYVKQALAINLKIFGENSIKYAESLSIMQNIYAAVADYERAEEAGEKVVKIQLQHYGKKHIQVASSLNELALIKYYNNNANKAEIEDLFIEALQIVKSNLSESNPQYAIILKNLALFYMETNKVAQSESMLEKADKIWIEKFGSDNIHSAEIDFLRGNVLYKKGKYKEANEKYLEASRVYSKIFDTNHPDYVKALSMAGRMSYILGDLKDAKRIYDETNAKYLSFIKKYFPSLSERQKNKYWSLIKSDFEFYASLALRLKDENPELLANLYNFSLNTKALLLNSSIKVKQRILGSNDPGLIKTYETWVSKKEFLTTVISMSAEQKKANMIDMAALEKEIDKLEQDLSQGSELFGKSLGKDVVYNWQLVQDNLDENEVALEIVRFRYFNKSFSDSIIYAAMIVSPKTKNHPDVVWLNNGKQLESKYLKYYRNCIKFKIEDNLSYDEFWKPIKKYIKDNAVVYLSADGAYTQINLEAIRTDNSYVLDQNEIVLVSNTKDIITSNKKSAKKKPVAKNEMSLSSITLFGNPTYYTSVASASADATIMNDEGLQNFKTSGKIAQLPGAEKEVKDLNTLLETSKWKCDVYLQDSASEERIKELKNPRVFHIATHGFFMEDVVTEREQLTGINENKAIQNPLLRAGLLLKNGGNLLQNNSVYGFNKEDGILTAYEAMNLYFDHTDLVVLSACETGVGEVQMGEGVFGLQRAFLVAGAKSVVMSLFKVSDEVTTELMTDFYKRWVDTGDKRKSFIAAKKDIKAKYKDPIYWGSFIMIGLE